MRRAVWVAIQVLAAASVASCAASIVPLIDGGVLDGGMDGGIGDAGNGDPRCSVANCEALLQCGFGLAGQPFNQVCMLLALDGGLAALQAINTRYCIEACQADDAGALVACVASFQGACADAGAMARQVAEGVFAVCSPYVDAGSADQACVASCGQTVDSCSNACPTDNGQDACFSCAYQCGQNYVQCAGGCP